MGLLRRRRTTKQTEESLQAIIADLRQSVAWMDLVFGHLSESICVVKKDGSVSFANDAFAVLSNQVRILLLGQYLWDFMLLEGKDKKSVDRALLHNSWSVASEHLLNGHYLLGKTTIELSAHYMPGLDQMILVIRDITDSERTHEKMLQVMHHLREQQQKLEEAAAKDAAMLESIGDAVVATDREGHIIFSNKSAENLFAIISTEIVGKPLITVLPFYDRDDALVAANERPLARALKTGRRVSNEDGTRYSYHLPDGTSIALSVIITPVILKDEIIGAIGTYRDITHAQEVDRMKTEFISIASHQLRTPLSAIKWFSEMLVAGDAGKLSVDQEDFAQNIASSTNRMIELVNSLLNISRLESGRIIVDPKPTDLKELIDGIVNDLRAKTEERHQNFVVKVRGDMPKINLDSKLISQVYLNLLTNAIKYTPKGGNIQVIIKHDGDYVLSEVSDTGYGIPEDQQDKMFQKFFRADNIVKVETDGTGLGMYLVKAIVDSSGGKIWFESEEGKGTTFWFTLPMSGMKAKKGEVTLDVIDK